jgi:hypothetical protein
MYWKKIKRKYKFKIYFPNGLDPQPNPATVNRASFPLNRCVPSSTPTAAMPGIPVVSSRQRHPAARPLARPCHYPSTPCGSPTPCRAMASAAPRAHVGRPMPAHLAWSVDKRRPDTCALAAMTVPHCPRAPMAASTGRSRLDHPES